MISKKLVIASLITIAFPLLSYAAPDYQKIGEKMNASGLKVKNVGPSPIQGLSEIVTLDGQIAYVSDDAKHVVMGEIFEVATRKNITADKLANTPSFDWSTLPFENAIVEKKGDGSRKIAIITDMNCGFCRKVEAEMDGITNVTVYRFIVGILGPKSIEVGKAAYCSKDPTKSYLTYIQTKTEPVATTSKCSAPLDANIELMKKLGVNGTPALLFMNGMKLNGAASRDVIESKLNSTKK